MEPMILVGTGPDSRRAMFNNCPIVIFQLKEVSYDQRKGR